MNLNSRRSNFVLLAIVLAIGIGTDIQSMVASKTLQVSDTALKWLAIGTALATRLQALLLTPPQVPGATPTKEQT